MKKMWLFALGGAIFCSCVKEPSPESQSGSTEVTQSAEVARLTTTETFEVPVKDGCVTKVVMDGEVIAEAVSPMSILVPRSVPTTKAAGLSYSFIPKEEYPNTIEENKAKLYQVVCFEDSRVGDYDYNDVVIHVKYQTKGKLFGLAVHPIALGSTKSLSVGCVVYKGNVQVFDGLINNQGENCRDQWFKGQSGFINTVGKSANFSPRSGEVGWHEYLVSSARCWDMSKVAATGPVRVEWYVQVESERYYALSTTYLSQSFDKNGLPLGVVISATGSSYEESGKGTVGHDWFNYPNESKPLQSVYPELWNWLTTSTASYNFADIYSKTVPADAFPAADLGLYTAKDLDVCDKAYLQN